jgi:hypothetical protein
LFRKLATASRDDSGQILLLTAFSMIGLLGIAALTLDASYAYETRNRLAATADAAAHSAAIEIWRGNSANYAAFAQGVITADKNAGRIPAAATATIRLCSDAGATCLPAYQLNTYVEVIVTATQSTYLGPLFNQLSLSPAARAVAGQSSGPNCIITLAGSPSLSIGNSEISAPTCGVAAGGNVRGTNPNSTITASSVTGLACLNHCDDITPFTPNSPPPTDPLRTLPAPAACTGSSANVNGGNWTAGCYSNVTLNGNVTMGSGMFVVNGSINISNNTDITGSSVTIYMGPSATITWGQHSSLNLTAPTSGTYNGIAFYMDRANTNPFTMQNNSDLSIVGAFYAAGSDVTIGNSLGNAGDCSLIVVRSLNIGNGNGHFNNTCNSYLGSPLTTASLAE